MEQGFNLPPSVVWFIIAAVIAVKLFFGSNKKPRKESTQSDEQIPGRSVEEILAELMGESVSHTGVPTFDEDDQTETEKGVSLPKPRSRNVAKAPKPKVAAPRATAESNPITESDLSSPQSGENVEFDLRQAVIMSEILNRKYNE